MASSGTNKAQKTILLKSEDDSILEVNLTAAMKLGTIRNVMEYFESDESMEDSVIPVMTVKGDVLKIIVQWLEVRKGKGHFVHGPQMLRKLAQGTSTNADNTSGDAPLLKTLMDIATAADYLDVPEILNITKKMLTLNTENCFILLEIIRSSQNQNILCYQAITEYIDHHFLDATKCNGFVNISYDTLQSVIARDSLNVPREENVVEAVVRWLEKHEDERCSIKDLLKHIRGKFIDLDYIKRCFGKVMKKEVDDTQYDELSVNMDQSEREGYKKSVLLFRNYVAEVYNFKTKEWTKTNLKFPENIEIIGVCQLGSLLVSVGLDSSDARKKFMPLILYKLDMGKWTEVKKIQNIDYSQKLEFMSMIPSSIHRILILFKRSVTAVDIDSNGLSIHTQVYSDPDFLTRYSELKEFSAKSFKGAIYIIGGTNSERKVQSKVSPLYSISEEMPEMNIKRQGASVAELNGLLYVAGGYNYDQRWLRSVECYDPATRTWTLVAYMNHVRYLAAMVAHQGRLYITGGCSGRRDTMEVYCPETDLWTDIDTKLVFSGRIGGAFVMKNYDLSFCD